MTLALFLRAAFLPAAFAGLLWLLGVDLDFALPEPSPMPQAHHATGDPVWVGPRR